eukprot:scaffold4060_cov121-Cylindrotheca_fusiformis.AAC.3
MSPTRIQPMKKLRSGATPVSRQRQPGTKTSTISIDADDAIARRRAELRRLQQQKSKHSSTRPKESTASKELVPKPSARARSMERKAPPPPPVARKLEFTGGNKQQPRGARAKSVPPRRPPPPPKKSEQVHKEAPPTVGNSSSATTTTTTHNKKKDLPPLRPSTDSAVSLPEQSSTASGADTAPPLFAEVTTTTETVKQQPQTAATTDAPPQQAAKPQTTAKTPAAKQKTTDSTSAASMMADPTALETKTPASKPPTTTEPPSTVRRERINQLRQGLDSPKSNKETKEAPKEKAVISETNAKLEKALIAAEKERNLALKRIQELEDKLMKEMTNTSKVPVTPVKDMTSLKEVMDMAKTQGEDAALKWAQEQLQGQEKLQHKHAGLLSPSIPTTPQPRRAIVNRAVTPHPKRDVKEGITDEDLEKRFITSFREAVAYIPYEYNGTSVTDDGKRCTYYVRRPYGIPDPNGIFELVSPSSHDKYSRKAHVSDPTSIQVAVAIPYDDSVLCLVGKMGVRYRITLTGSFENIPNVEDSLGFVSYIDDTANERQYSLDEILEEALSVREQYCSTMMTTALGFQQRKPVVVAGDAAPATAAAPKPQVAEIGVDTSDIPIPQEIKLSENSQRAEAKKEEPKKKESPKKEMEEDTGSTGAGDVLTIFIGMIFKSIFGFIWWILIGLPLATIRVSVTMILACVVVGVLYLYALDGHYSAMSQGENSFFYASQYHANTAPGLL